MRLRWVVGGVGALATVLAALAVFGAGLAPVAGAVEPLVTALSGLGTQGLVFASVVLAVLGLAASLLVPGGERVLADDGAADRFERRLDRPPEDVARAAPLTGGTLDDDVARAVAGDEGALSAVRDRLRDLAETVVADVVDDPAAAAERVASGEWTDDRTAAAFLADGTPTASLRSRLRLWLDPERERERRVRRTAAAVDRLADEQPPTSVAATPGERDAEATRERESTESASAEQNAGVGDAGAGDAEPSATRAGDAGASGGGE